MRFASTLVLGGLLLLVIPALASAGWQKQCETITKLEEVRLPGGIAQRPVTETICRDVWVPEPDQKQEAKKQIELMTAMVKLCKELEIGG